MNGVSRPAKRLARETQDSPWARGLARAGFVASGVVHALLGTIVLIVAFGGEGEADQAGAFKAIGAAPLGFALLWVLALALWALAAWQVLDGLLVRDSGTAKKWGRRLSEWGKALIYGALGAIAASVALGARPDADETARSASGVLLQVPGGPFLLGAVGAGIGIGGIVFGVIGVRRGFLKLVALPPGRMGGIVTATGMVGYIAKGVALAIVGVLLIVAAVTVDPSAAGGIDGAIDALIALPLGPLLAGTVGVGLLAYAAFLFLRARYAKL